MSKSRPINLFRLSEILRSEESTREFLLEHSLIERSKKCPFCRADMKLDYSRSQIIGEFRCQKNHASRGNNIRRSRAKGTWFENAKLGVQKTILITYCFAYKFKYEDAKRECALGEEDTELSDATLTDWYNYCREICCLALDRDYEEEGPIGGDGHLVEIDEMKLGRRKYHRGRIVDGHWILGFIDRDTKDYRLEICPDNKRDTPTMRALINKHVKKGNIIIF